METIVTTLTEEELKAHIREAVKSVLTELLPALQQQTSDILDVKQAAEFLRLKVTTLYEKTCLKLIPHFKKGGKLYFNQRELEAWILKGKVKTSEELFSEVLVHKSGTKD